ncbi:MAG: hypothetical protein ACI8PT_001187 [Gammaproteobacteria bacterium]|jgi:hypothetical protein
MARGLDRLVDSIAKTVLPCAVTAHAQLCALTARKGVSGQQVARLVAHDPGYSVALLRELARRSRAGDSVEEEHRPTSIGHLLTLIGLESALAILRKIPTTASLTESTKAGYQRASARGAFAAHCAYELGQRIGDPTAGELRLATTAKFFAENALWIHDNGLAHRVEAQATSSERAGPQQTSALLEGSFDQVTKTLTARWGLPKLTTASAPELTANAIIERAIDPIGRREVTVAICARLGSAGTLGWGHPFVQETITLLAGLARFSQDKACAWVHSQAAHSARKTPCDNEFSPASALWLTPSSVLPPPAKTDAGTHEATATLASKSKSTLSKASWRPTAPSSGAQLATANSADVVRSVPTLIPNGTHCISIVRNFLAGQCGVGQLLKEFTDAIAQDLGLDRAILALATPDAKQITPRFFSGIEEPAMREALTASLTDANLFARLMTKPTAMLVSLNNPKYQRLLPPNLRAASDTDKFFAASVFSGERAVGILYGDFYKQASATPTITPDKTDEFRKRAQMLSQALAKAKECVRKAS